jgi:hypothetical protein
LIAACQSAPTPTTIPATLPPPSPARSFLPFGPFHWPESEFGEPFTGAFRSLRPQDAISLLEAARAAGTPLIINLAGSRRNFQEASGAFSPEKFKERLDLFKGIDFDSYVADGTIVGHMLFDEAHDPSNWNRRAVPYADIEAAAAYSHQLWPDMPTGVGSHPSFLMDGAPWKSLDFAFAQYTERRGDDIKKWSDEQVRDAHQSGLALVLSLNVLHGNNGGAVTASQLRTWGVTLAEESYACALLMWKYDEEDDGAYFRDPAIVEAVTAIGQAARERKAPACKQ